MGDSNGTATIVAAAILGLCILGASFMLGKSIDGASEELAGMQAAIAKAGTGAVVAAAAQPAAAPAQRRRGPDPSKVYEVKAQGAPTIGPKVAKVTIAEFADFQ